MEDMLLVDALGAAEVLCDVLGGNGEELQHIFHSLLCAGLPYLAASAAYSLQPVRLLRGVAEDMYLSVACLVPGGKLHSGDSLNAVALS